MSHNVDEVCNPEDIKSARECLSDMIEEIEKLDSASSRKLRSCSENVRSDIEDSDSDSDSEDSDIFSRNILD